MIEKRKSRLNIGSEMIGPMKLVQGEMMVASVFEPGIRPTRGRTRLVMSIDPTEEVIEVQPVLAYWIGIVVLVMTGVIAFIM